MNTKNTWFNRIILQQFLISNLKSVALIQIINQVNEVCSKGALLIIKSANEPTLLNSVIYPCKVVMFWFHKKFAIKLKNNLTLNAIVVTYKANQQQCSQVAHEKKTIKSIKTCPAL